MNDSDNRLRNRAASLASASTQQRPRMSSEGSILDGTPGDSMHWVCRISKRGGHRDQTSLGSGHGGPVDRVIFCRVGAGWLIGLQSRPRDEIGSSESPYSGDIPWGFTL